MLLQDSSRSQVPEPARPRCTSAPWLCVGFTVKLHFGCSCVVIFSTTKHTPNTYAALRYSCIYLCAHCAVAAPVHLATKILPAGRALLLMNLSTSPEAEQASTLGLNRHNPGNFCRYRINHGCHAEIHSLSSRINGLDVKLVTEAGEGPSAVTPLPCCCDAHFLTLERIHNQQ